VPAEPGLHRHRRHLTRLQRERRIRELGQHVGLLEKAEVPTVRGARVLAVSLGKLGKVSAGGELSLGLTAVGTHYGAPLLKRPEPYNLFEFSGKNNLGLGLDYSYVWRNLLLFGETARTTGGAVGTVNGLLASLGPTADAAV